MKRKLLMLFVGLVFVTSSFLYVKESIKRRKSINIYSNIKDEYYNLKKSPSVSQPDLSLKYKNMVGWIKVEGTNIDYPVVKYKNNSYYLTHNPLNQRDPSGSIFMDYRVDYSKGLKNIVIYGHNMKNGTMFHELEKFKNTDFLKNQRKISLELNKTFTEWEVFSTYETSTDFNFAVVNFKSKREFNDYIKLVKNKSIYKTSIELSEDDQILTLSTCTYSIKDGRLVVHARRVR